MDSGRGAVACWGVGRELPAELTEERERLFHDAAPGSIDPEVHASFVIERTLDHGTMRSVAALVRFYSRDRIREFLAGDGRRRVSSRTWALWSAYLGIDESECAPTFSPRISAPFWTP